MQPEGQQAACRLLLAARALQAFSWHPPPLEGVGLGKGAAKLLAAQLPPFLVTKQPHWPTAQGEPLTVAGHTAHQEQGKVIIHISHAEKQAELMV